MGKKPIIVIEGGNQGGFHFTENNRRHADGRDDVKVIVDKSHIGKNALHILESEFPDLKDNPRVTELLAKIHNRNYPANSHGVWPE